MENKETTYNLPDSWIWTTLGEIGIVTSGGTPSSRQPDFWGGDIAWITPADLSNYKNKYIEQGQRSISKVGLDNSSAKLLPKGTVLFSSRAPIGYTVIAKNEIATNQGFKNLILTKSGYPDYIYYFLLASKQLAESYASGTTFLELSATKFSQIPFPLPPLVEQYRIVDKIEELFSELDKAQENLLNAQKQLENYRIVVLNNNFNSNDKRNDILKIRDVFYLIDGDRGKNYPKQNDYVSNGHCLFLSTKNVRNNKFIFDDNLFISIDKHNELRSGKLEKGDIVLTTRGTLGNTALYNDKVEYNVIRINSGMLILRNKNTKYNLEYLSYYFLSQHFKKQIEIKKTGTAQPQLPKNILYDFEIIIAEYSKQKKIVQEIDYQFTLIENLEKSIIDNLKRIEVFRHVILQRAFLGNLVSQNKNDKPANELLKRIKEEIRIYQIQQKEIAKSKPQKLVFMESNKTIKELLEDATEPMEAKEVWQRSVHKDDIEKFYEELKKISADIEEIREGKISKIFLKK